MHGIIFKSMKDYVVQEHGQEAWEDICREASLEQQIYLTVDTYEDGELLRIADATADLNDVSIPTFLESYGRFAAIQLLNTYQNVVHDDWSALELIANAEEHVHTTLRTYNADMDPPELVCRQDSDSQVTVFYHSDRRLCFVAKGIIHGIADYYEERLDISEAACMHDSENYCKIIVKK